MYLFLQTFGDVFGFFSFDTEFYRPLLALCFFSGDCTLLIVRSGSAFPRCCRGPIVNPRTVYGGELMAQALMAASQTVPEGFSVHSMHCHFHGKCTFRIFLLVTYVDEQILA